MSDSKHYTPSIEELTPELDWEIILTGTEPGQRIWQKEKVKDNLIWKTDDSMKVNVSRIEYILKNKTVRVKRLDREDIESLGFKKQYSEMSLMFTGGSGEYTRDIYTITFLHFNHDDTYYGKVSIWMGEMKKSQVRLFHGILKNKSQLKQILQWTGVIK